MFLICGFLFGNTSSVPQYSNHSNPSYIYTPQSDGTLPVILTSKNRHDNHFDRYRLADISTVNFIGKVSLKLLWYSDNDSGCNNQCRKSLFYQDCLLQI